MPIRDADWILNQLTAGKSPEEIAREVEDQQPDGALWESMIQRAKQLGSDARVRPYLLTLFHAARMENDWLWLRILGIIAQTPAFEMQERQNALSSIDKRLTRMEKAQQANPDAESEAQITEYRAYLLVLQGSMHIENGESEQAVEHYRQARALYLDLKNTNFVTWLDAQLKKLTPISTHPPIVAAPRPVQPTIAPVAARTLPQASSAEPDTELVNNLKAQLTRQEEQVERLSKEVDRLNRKNISLQEELDACSQEMDALIAEQEQPDVRDRTEDTDLRQQLEFKEGELEDLRDIVRHKDQQVIDLQRELQSRHDLNGQLRRQLQQKQDEINQLKNKLEELDER